MFLTYLSVLSFVVRLGSEQVIIIAQVPVPALVRYSSERRKIVAGQKGVVLGRLVGKPPWPATVLYDCGTSTVPVP